MQISGLNLISRIINELYKATQIKKSIADIAKSVETSAAVVLKVKEILVAEKLLVVSGERRAQIMWWAPGKSLPNDRMNARIHSIYVSKGKPKKKTREKKVSIETALHVLSDAGFTGVIQKKKSTELGYVIEFIDLDKF